MSSLASTSWGSGPLLVLCHGFTQNAATWGRFGAELGEHHTILAVDLPGHGGSAERAGSIDDAAEGVLDLTRDEPFSLLGYSMGGRVALTAALRRPPNLEHLVLIGATAGIESPLERSARRSADERLADSLEQGDLREFLDRWLSQPIFATLPRADANVDARATNSAAGLAQSLRAMGTGTQDPSWDRLHDLRTPTLYLAGTLDLRYAAVGRRLIGAVPDGSLRLILGAGHACHLEQPVACAETITTWLSHGGH